MDRTRRVITILIADDDDQDKVLIARAWQQARLGNPLAFVSDGEELLAYLKQEGDYAPPAKAPRPGLILLDLNMPRLDGHEALKLIKADPTLASIPVVVMTSSAEQQNILESHMIGVSAYAIKPVGVEQLLQVVKGMGRHWVEISELPD